jgi:hypothetical protein
MATPHPARRSQEELRREQSGRTVKLEVKQIIIEACRQFV